MAKLTGTHIGLAALLSFLISSVLMVVDVFFLTPSGAQSWEDALGNPVPPGMGIPIGAEPHLLGAPMGFVLVGAFLAALAAFWMAPEKPR